MDYIAKNQPDVLIQIGDFMDFFSLSSYKKRVPPKDRLYLHKEINTGRIKLKQWAQLAPNARKVLIAGNHEQRLESYLELHAAELYGLEEMSVPSLLQMDQSGWEYLGPYGAGVWLCKNRLWCTHGQYVRKYSAYAAKEHVERMGLSVIHGHTHRLGSFFKTHSLTGKQYVGYEVGCIADFKRTPKSSSSVDWQHGFAQIWVDGHNFKVDLVPINNGKCIVHGERYGR